MHRNVQPTIKLEDCTPLALSDHDHSFLQEAFGVEEDSPDDQADQKLLVQLLKPNIKYFLVQKWIVRIRLTIPCQKCELRLHQLRIYHN